MVLNLDQIVKNVRIRQWMEMIQQQKNSGLGVTAWCNEKGLSKNAFYYRQRKVRLALGNKIGDFVEIPLIDKSHRTLLPIKVEEISHNKGFSISTDKFTMNLHSDISEELLSMIVRTLNADKS